jgi:predicted metal-dependent phosphoesterase TrpH
LIDLHVHSNYSDGTDSPAELIQKAEQRGLSALALTDHDTVTGVPPLLEAAGHSPVEGISGVELSAECARGTMHILGYFIDHTCRFLLERIDTLRSGREERNLAILKKLNKLGYVLMWNDVEKQAGLDVVGRPHFADALVARGHVKSRKRAFDMLLAKGRPAYVERYRYKARECIELIRAAGGVSVLAHPGTLYLPDDQMRGTVMGLAEHGLNGIEVFTSDQHPGNVLKFSKWADEFGLIRTGGTDYHGRNTPDLQLGSGFGQLRIPDEVLDQLKAAIPR